MQDRVAKNERVCEQREWTDDVQTESGTRDSRVRLDVALRMGQSCVILA